MSEWADKGADQGRGDATPEAPCILDELRRSRILIVDAAPANLALLRAILKKGGFTQLTAAGTGGEMLAHLRAGLSGEQAPVDALLLDVELPDQSAFELCAALRAQDECASLPIILITDNPGWDERLVHQAYACGATDILFRPTRGSELLPRLLSALSLRRDWDHRRQRESRLATELAELKVLETRLQYLVGHDDLTGLYNRRRLEQALELAVLQARHNQRTSALLYLDLDQFKLINNCEGHCAGDHLLVRVANTLRQFVSDVDTLARIGADEYAVLVENCTRQQALDLAEKLRCVLGKIRFEAGGKVFQVGTSIGIALIAPEATVTASEALAQADQACFVAKSHGRNTVHFFSRDDTELQDLHSNMRWGPLIRDALAADRFQLVFQPVLHIADGTVRHYEVLVRMLDEHGECLESADFIAAAERMGLIHEIDRWVVARAIGVLETLPPQHADVSFNVNLSGHAFQDLLLLPLVRERLRTTGVDARRITFEITETAAVANFNQTRKMVNQLRALGCRFALDDFGSGFNSYNYLKQFPVDYLKIDGTFVSNLTRDPVDQALVKSMVEIAHTLGKETVAEFVGNEETLALLRSYGVDYAQGYFIGKPQEHLLGAATAAATPLYTARPVSR